MNEILIYKNSEKALNERRELFYALKVTAALCLASLVAWLGWDKPLAWLVLGLGLTLLYRLKTDRLLRGYASRTLTLQPQALEESSLGFTRFVLFEQITLLRVTQSMAEKVLAVEIKTAQGSFVLRGYENMGTLFVALSARKPADVLIEVNPVRLDLDRPWPWALAALAAGALLALALFLDLLLS